MVGRKNEEPLTDLAQEIQRLVAKAFPVQTGRTTHVVARDDFVEALRDSELIMQVQAQRPTDLDSSLQLAKHMEAVVRSITGRSGKAVRAVVQDTMDPRVAVALKELKAGQDYLLELLQQLSARQEHRAGDGSGGEQK